MQLSFFFTIHLNLFELINFVQNFLIIVSLLITILLSFYFEQLGLVMCHLKLPQYQQYLNYVNIVYPMQFYSHMDIFMDFLEYHRFQYQICKYYYHTVSFHLQLNVTIPLVIMLKIMVYDDLEKQLEAYNLVQRKDWLDNM